MPVNWGLARDIELGGVVEDQRKQIDPGDAQRQTETARTILERLRSQPGVLLADEVGMGKTYVAMAVIASVIVSTRRTHCPVVIMVPAGLRRKWQRDWEQFKAHCVRDHVLDWVHDKYAHTPTEFFKLLDNPVKRRAHLIFITTGCFSRGLNDPWVKLAMIRLARSMMKLTDVQKRRLYRWAADLVRQFSNSRLTEDVVSRLLNSDILNWKRILIAERILSGEDDDPVPDRLSRDAHLIDWKKLCTVLRELPGWRPQSVKAALRKNVRRQFSEVCHDVYRQWLNLVRWRSPLLVLDEAHHAKNDSTYLAQLFRQETEDDVALLQNKFDRMVFLTATPFQLGHQELIRVLRSFAAGRWASREAPAGSREDFMATMSNLEQALDRNRLSGRRFDRLWGKLRPEILGNTDQHDNEENLVLHWWKRVEVSPSDEPQQQLLQAYQECVSTREGAEQILKPWLIRHNRLPYLSSAPDKLRRKVVVGKAVVTNEVNDGQQATEGIPIHKQALLPFLITARAQGELAQYAGTRAFFAEGLASSYEAFHHTREKRCKSKDFDDGLAVRDDNVPWLVPTKWYEEQISQLIPSRDAARSLRIAHPKISATVERAVSLWDAREKVVVFCFYIQTAQALYEHLSNEVNLRILNNAGKKLGLNAERHADKVQGWLARIIRRLSNVESPFYREIRALLEGALDKPGYDILQRYREQLLGVLLAYFRSPAFVAGYLPLEDPLVRKALGERETRQNVISKGVSALRRAITEERDASNQTYLGRIDQFLDFASELAKRAERHLALKEDETSDESENPLLEYLNAVSIYSRPRRPEKVDEDTVQDETDDGSYRVMPLVRIVYGKTSTEIRDRLMLAFNSPLFPEILVSSSVMGEGVDLHRFCRHVIHHDLCWNPSTLEQRTGRLDRVRCKAEVCSQSIEVYEPFLAGSADEKMFRVLRDRERWFQIVMGQRFEFDEATSEAITCRLPLPNELAKRLTFSLSCWSAAPV